MCMSLNIEIFSIIMLRFSFFFINFILNFFGLCIEDEIIKIVHKHFNMLKELENFVLGMLLYIVFITSSRINDERELLSY